MRAFESFLVIAYVVLLFRWRGARAFIILTSVRFFFRDDKEDRILSLLLLAQSTLATLIPLADAFGLSIDHRLSIIDHRPSIIDHRSSICSMVDT